MKIIFLSLCTFLILNSVSVSATQEDYFDQEIREARTIGPLIVAGGSLTIRTSGDLYLDTNTIKSNGDIFISTGGSIYLNGDIQASHIEIQERINND